MKKLMLLIFAMAASANAATSDSFHCPSGSKTVHSCTAITKSGTTPEIRNLAKELLICSGRDGYLGVFLAPSGIVFTFPATFEQSAWEGELFYTFRKENDSNSGGLLVAPKKATKNGSLTFFREGNEMTMNCTLNR